MIRRNGEYESVVKEKMFGGNGDVRIEHFWVESELKANNRLFSKIIIQPNESIGFHTHKDEEEVLVIIKGQAEANDNGKIEFLDIGDTILTPENTGHSIKCVSEEPLEMLAVISCYK